MSSASGKRIKSIRPRSDRDVKSQWAVIENGLSEIYKKNASHLSFEELYRNAYNMVLHKAGNQLYDGTKKFIKEFLEDKVTHRLVPTIHSTQDIMQGKLFLDELKSLWNDHLLCLGMTRDILMYLDRTYVKTAMIPVTYDMGLDLFHDIVLVSEKIQYHLIETVLVQVSHERQGDVIDRMLLRSIIQMILSLPTGTQPSPRPNVTFYEAEFEPTFLEKSRAFYKNESQKLMTDSDVPSFLLLIENRLVEEKTRVQQYMASTTESKLVQIVLVELVSSNIKKMIEMPKTGLVSLVENKAFDDLQRMYQLFSMVNNGLAQLSTSLAAYIKHLGKTINDQDQAVSQEPQSSASQNQPENPSRPSSADGQERVPRSAEGSATDLNAAGDGTTKPPGRQQISSSPVTWVDAMIRLKDPFDYLLIHCFGGDNMFEVEFNNAVQHVVNMHPKAPEYISLFIDEHLRKSFKGKTEEEIESILNKCISLFKFVDEKDTFERYYKQHLAKRLLTGKSMGEDVEKSVIGKLKVECGQQFTKKLEGMFNDMSLSSDLTQSFQEYLQASSRPELQWLPDVFVNVLTYTNWPIPSPSSSFIFPSPMSVIVNSYEHFYKTKYSGRKLTWLPHMGSVDMKIHFDKGKKEVNMSLYAATVLLNVFDISNGDSQPLFTMSEIQEKTDLNEQDLTRTLQSLSMGKYKMLLKSTKSRSIQPTDTFSFNSNFSCPLNKIRILTVASSSSDGRLETDSERQETVEKINQSRGIQIEAAVVRIMKSRKELDHTSLVTHVISQLSNRFHPNPGMIKKRIEGLIEREYLERDSVQRSLYRYLA